MFTSIGNAGFLLNSGLEGGTFIGSGGTEFVSGGGLAAFTTDADATQGPTGGGLILFSGGTSVDTVVTQSSQEAAFSGGTAIGATVLSGGVELVFAGGTEIDPIISNGGLLLNGLGFTPPISAGGVVSSALLLNGAIEFVFSGGTDIDDTVESGAVMFVSSGGTDIAPTVDIGGTLFISSGGAIQFSGGVVPAFIPFPGAIIELTSGSYGSACHRQRDSPWRSSRAAPEVAARRFPARW